jgi:pimeloyl-ACP methyl ester carboxylesterase
MKGFVTAVVSSLFFLPSRGTPLSTRSSLPTGGLVVNSYQHHSGFTCTELVIPFSVQENTDIHYDDSNYGVEVLYGFMDRKIFATATYNVSAVHCAPPRRSGRGKDTIQLLAHGATFNKLMWDWPWQPEKYSWVRRMHAAGYPTLTFDEVGSGNSSLPHGLYETQTQVLVEQVHHLAKLLKAGEIGGVRYKKVAYVGFSIGAIAGVSLASRVPDALDAILLHGYTWKKDHMYPAFLSGLQGPGNSLGVPHWNSYPDLYSTQTTPASRQAAVFYGDYDPDMLPVDFALRDMDALGLAITFAYHVVSVPRFRGPVMMAIGQRKSEILLLFIEVGETDKKINMFASSPKY